MALILHRTRNKGVTGVKGQYTKGPYYSSGAVTASVKPSTVKGKSKK